MKTHEERLEFILDIVSLYNKVRIRNDKDIFITLYHDFITKGVWIQKKIGNPNVREDSKKIFALLRRARAKNLVNTKEIDGRLYFMNVFTKKQKKIKGRHLMVYTS